MSLGLIFSIIFIHWVADFVFQTDWQAQNKSKNNKALLSHTWTYSLVWFTFGAFYAMSDPNYVPWSLSLFVLITFVAHTITDYFTSRLNSKLWAKGDVHNFFVSVGFDQVLHYVQLFGTFYLLTK
jgi:hypothetical protein